MNRHRVVIRVGRILESLVAVNDQSSHVPFILKSFPECLQNKIIVISLC